MLNFVYIDFVCSLEKTETLVIHLNHQYQCIDKYMLQPVSHQEIPKQSPTCAGFANLALLVCGGI